MARTGFTCKELSAILDVQPTRVTQSVDPALAKIARMWRVNPTRTLQSILAELERLEPMSDAELAIREAMLNGTADRQDIHPK